MKLKIWISIVVALLATLFVVSCNDDIDSIGETIQPDVDNILLDVDEVLLTAETVSLNEKFYIHPGKALLGELDDPVFGNIKADFLTEFFCADNVKFELGKDNTASIDSVFLHMGYLYTDIIGDTVQSMGVSVYEVNKKSLNSNFYTNIDPLDYTDMKVILGQRFFSPQDLPQSSGRYISIQLNTEYGQNLYDEWVRNPSVLANSESLKKFMKGIYVTSNFNNKALVELIQTNVNISYSYKIDHVDGSPDSTVTRTLLLPVTEDVNRMNRVKNTPLKPNESMDPLNERTFIHAPAGVVTKITIPIAEIKRKAKERTKSDKFIINTAAFKLVGMTEEEDKLSITKRPSALLFINQDSIKNFFLEGRMANGTSSLTMVRNSSNNSYSFTYQNAINRSYYDAYNNIASLINYYIKKDETIENLEYYVIPVDFQSTTASGSSITTLTSITNLLTPSAAILRTKEDNLKMSLIFSKYNEIVPK